MIKIENVNVYNFENAIRGMRNPLNSWNRIDSCYDENGNYILGKNDLDLATRLQQGGEPHRKFLRQIFVSVDITAPLYWFKEADTYKVGTTANSTSTMHKITSRELTLEDFSTDKCTFKAKKTMKEIVNACNELRNQFVETKDKQYWYSLIQVLPSSYNQKRTVTLNYEVLSNMYKWRKDHKLDEWKEFCKWVETLPYAKELIIGTKKKEVDLIKMAECIER